MKKAICILVLVAVLALCMSGNAEYNMWKYIGSWQGGPRYSEDASEYTLTISQQPDGEYPVELEVYRITVLEGSIIDFDSDGNEAIVSLDDGNGQYLVGILTFFSDSIRLDIVQHNVLDLTDDSFIWFE